MGRYLCCKNNVEPRDDKHPCDLIEHSLILTADLTRLCISASETQDILILMQTLRDCLYADDTTDTISYVRNLQDAIGRLTEHFEELIKRYPDDPKPVFEAMSDILVNRAVARGSDISLLRGFVKRLEQICVICFTHTFGDAKEDNDWYVKCLNGQYGAEMKYLKTNSPNVVDRLERALMSLGDKVSLEVSRNMKCDPGKVRDAFQATIASLQMHVPSVWPQAGRHTEGAA